MSSGKVLIAHGNTRKLRDAVDLLRGAGFEVIATPDGGDAFARFFEEEPETVLCSAQLPGLSGVSFAAMVQSQAPGTRVVILIDPDEEPTTLEGAPGVATVLEPLTMEALRAAIPSLPERAASSPMEDAFASQTTSGVFALAALKRFQRDNSLLAVMDDRGLSRIAAMAKHELRQNDERVITEGDPGDGFYLVVEGQVRVTLAEKNNQEIARIGAGGFFGEMAMMSDRKRSASVWTVGQTTLLFFGRNDFMPLLEDYPTLREVLSGVALKRTEENLWRTLFDDVDVQRSLGSLSEVMPAAPVELSAAPVELSAPRNEAVPPRPPPETMLEDAPGGEGFDDFDGLELQFETKEEKPAPPPKSDSVHDRELHDRVKVQLRAAEATEARKRGLFAGLAAGCALGLVIGFGAASMRQRPVVEETAQVAEQREAEQPTADVRPPTTEDQEPGLEDRPAAAEVQQPTTEDRQPKTATPAPKTETQNPKAETPAPKTEVQQPNTATPAPTTETPPPKTEAPPPPTDAQPPKTESPAPPTEGQQPKTDAAPPAATEPGAAAPSAQPTISEAERKRLRRELFAGVHADDHAKAIAAGLALEKANALDWEANFYLARAQQQGGMSPQALQRFTEFITNYPHNDFVDEAQFYSGEILQARGRKTEAIEAFRAVVANPKSSLIEQAQAHLKALDALP